MKTFGELTRDEKIALMTAWVDGESIEYEDAGWHSIGYPSWTDDCAYRVAKTKPSINWDHVHPDYIAISTDRNMLSFAYKKRPHVEGSMWSYISETSHSGVCSYASFKPGNCDWKDSLVMRPGHE